MLEIFPSDNIDDDINHIFTGLPTSPGVIRVRVISEFQNLQGNNGRDAISIDHMFIRCDSDGTPPTPPPTPTPTTTPTPTPTPPVCIPTHNKEKGPRCSDGLDNDCDGLIDGADLDC
jgi:hypothetical protein